MSFEPAPPPIRPLDAKYYTDPEIFRAELDGLLATTWHYAGHISQIPRQGDYFVFELNGESLFCIRGSDNEIRAFYNVCQHRAHPLLQGDGNTNLLVCPYHAWAYDHFGQLRAGPNIKSVEGFDKSCVNLTRVRIENFLGFLFVNLDPDAKSMDEWFPNVREELKAYVPHIEELMVLEWVEIEEHCNWKISVENYSECYHCQINHPVFSSGVIDPESYDIQPQGYCLRHTTQCQDIDRMTYEVDLESNPHAGDYSSWYLWPMFSFQVYPGNILNTYLWRATGPETVTVWRGWYTINGSDDEVIRRLAAQDRASTVEEDIQLVEAVQRGLRSRGYTPGPLVIDPAGGVRSEHSLRALHEWMRDQKYWIKDAVEDVVHAE